MEIKEAIALYEFLGNINGSTFFGIYILLMITLYAVIIPATDKLGINTKTNSYKAILISFAVLISVSLALIYCEARNKTELKSIGVRIKSDMVYTGYTRKSFRQIASPNVDTLTIDELFKLACNFPNEFTIVKMPFPISSDTLDIYGIDLIDNSAVIPIYKSIEEKAKQAAPLIKKLLLDHNLDILYTDKTNHPYSIQYDIDNTGWLIGPDFFQALIGKDSLFPVYTNNYRIVGFTLMNKRTDKKENKIAYDNIVKELTENHLITKVYLLDDRYELKETDPDSLPDRAIKLFQTKIQYPIGFIALRDSLNIPGYTDDFLKELINNSNEQLLFVKLEDNGNHDTLGIILPKK